MKPNLMMPGHPRYQPEELKPYYGYDKYVTFLLRVEIALLEVLGEIGFIPANTFALFTEEVKTRLLTKMTTTMADKEEEKTQHDVQAMINVVKRRRLLPKPLVPYFHYGATSYDPISTANALIHKEAYNLAIRPQLNRFCLVLAAKAALWSDVVCLGRTHLQPANPITMGFRFITDASRLMDIRRHLNQLVNELCGKMSGAVGASNAFVEFGIEKLSRDFGDQLLATVEDRVMTKLGLAVPISSTQIVPPEPLQRFMFEFVELAGCLNQTATSCRLLYAPEFGEVVPTGFIASEHTGSSAMPHKRNPIRFENTGGMHEVVRAMLGLLPGMSVSWLERDLTGSVPLRYLPIIPICVMVQLRRMTAAIDKLTINPDRISQNLTNQSDFCTSEAYQLALRQVGYPNAHQVVNQLIARAKEVGAASLFEVINDRKFTAKFPGLTKAWGQIDNKIRQTLKHPGFYIGNAIQKTRHIAEEIKAEVTNCP